MNNLVVGWVFNFKGSGVSMVLSKRNRILVVDMFLLQFKSIFDVNFFIELWVGFIIFVIMFYIIVVNVRCCCGIFFIFGILIFLQVFIFVDMGFDCECKKLFDNVGNCVNNKEWIVCYEGQLKIYESIYFMCYIY